MTCRRGQYVKVESNTQQMHRPRGSLSFRKSVFILLAATGIALLVRQVPCCG
ncbi:hypothetical protein K474DRAFT_1668543 [Panus rudis PR-1116 ss-1]|nr:hypothetical protein K474DRAFT_1668543 [Panus rudis PR-1116 ss-1]